MKPSFAAGAAALLLSSIVVLGPRIIDPYDDPVHGPPVPTTFATAADDVVAKQTYDWPSGGEVPVVRDFSPPEERWLTGHRGVDLAMDEGAEVLAAGDGRVIHAGRLNDRNLVSIEHADGLRTTYEPVSPTVAKGDAVSKGQRIGTLELGHAGPLPVLHWGAKYPEDRYIDPLSLLERVPIRLWE